MDPRYMDERDAEGNPTPLALALRALSENGCNCDRWPVGFLDSPEDETGTCCACRCEAALEYLVEKLESLNRKVYGRLGNPNDSG